LGRGGRRFESCHPDKKTSSVEEVFLLLFYKF
jgi:hypothetical protein